MLKIPFLRVWLLASLAATLSGCSHGPPYGDVSGKVALDGQPIVSGVLRLIPIDGNTGGGGGAITNGQYVAAHVPVNTFRVEISAAKPLPTGVDPTKVMGQELLPPKYNVESKLTLEVKEGPNQHDFELDSK
jgi:hypothetical protein